MDKKEVAAKASQQTEPKNYESVMEFLRDGYGPRLAQVLMTCMERYLYATDALDMCPGKRDADNMWYLCTLLKCILKDEHGIDLEG